MNRDGKIPTFDEVMSEPQKVSNGRIPSFEDIMNGTVKKKEEASGTISEPSPNGIDNIPQSELPSYSAPKETKTKSFLDLDIERQPGFLLTNPELDKPQNKYSLRNLYNEAAQKRYDEKLEISKSNIKATPESLATYNQKRLDDVNKDIKSARDNIKGLTVASASGGKILPEQMAPYEKTLAEAEQYKERLKNGVAVEAAKVFIPMAIAEGPRFDPTKLARNIVKIADPEQEKRFQDAERYGTTLPGITQANLERMGLDITEDYLKRQPQTEQSAAIIKDIEERKISFDERNPELTAQNVREKLGVYFYNKGKSGFWGYSGRNIESAINDPETGLTPSEKKIAINSVLPTENKLIFTTEIPGSGFFRSFKGAIEKSIINTSNTVNDLFGGRDDLDRAQENLNAEVEQSRFRQPGENPTWKQELMYLNNKPELTAEEKTQKVNLEKFVDVRNGFSKFKDGMGDLTGQVAEMALLSKGIGAAGRAITVFGEGGGMLSNLTTAAGATLSNQTVGLFVTSYLNAYDNYRAQALQLMPGDENAANRRAYATVMGGIEGLSERIFNDTKILKAFTKGVAPSVADITNRFINKEITQQVAREELQSTLRQYLKPFGKEFVKSEIQEPTEEAVVDLADGMAQSIFGGQPFDINKTGSKALNTFLTTALNSPLVSGLAAHGAVRQNNTQNAFMKSAIVDMANNPTAYLKSVEDLRLTNQITQDEANEKIQLIKSSSKFLKEMPSSIPISKKTEGETTIENKELDYPEVSSYLLHRLNEAIVNRQLESNNDEALKPVLEQQVKRSVEIRKGIIDGSIGVTPDLEPITDNEKKAQELGIADANTVPSDQLIGTPFQEAQKAKRQEEAKKEVVEADDNITVGEMVDKVGTYKGQRGRFYQDGQTVVFKVEGQPKEYEVGNIDEVKDTPINKFDIAHEESVVSVSDAGELTVRGENFKNNFSDPTEAINYDNNGNVVSVNLENDEGKKRTFRGNIAEDLAYQIQLQQISTNDATRESFEDYINQDPESQAEMESETFSETAESETTTDNKVVSREKIEAKVVEPENVTEVETPSETAPVAEQQPEAKSKKESKPKKAKDEIQSEPTTSKKIKVFDVSLGEVNTEKDVFQNRETEFSQESVDKIKKAAKEGTFNWEEFDPVLLWKNPKDGKLYVLSGHSRLEAFKQLSSEGNKDFGKIPSKIIEGTIDEARQVAMRSNTLGTKESPIERASYYRKQREAGKSKSELAEEAKDNEGRNANTIVALSYLNPKGKAVDSLRALGQEADTKSKANSIQIARWIGETRRMFPQITNEHENEIFDWLAGGAYDKIKNIGDITSRLNTIISRIDFDATQPLNLENKATKTYVDEQYESQLKEKEDAIKEQQKLIDVKTKRYHENELSPSAIAEKNKEDNAILHRLQKDLIDLKNKKSQIAEANKSILGLFDNIQNEIKDGNIKPEQVERIAGLTDAEATEFESSVEALESKAEIENEQVRKETSQQADELILKYGTPKEVTKPISINGNEEKSSESGQEGREESGQESSEENVKTSEQGGEDVGSVSPPLISKKAGDAVRKFADKLRTGKINKLGGFKSTTGFDAVWDASLEVVAKSLEGGALIADAIQIGLDYIKGTDWYNNLTDKEGFDEKYSEHMESESQSDESWLQRRFTKQMLRSDELSDAEKGEISKTLNYARRRNAITIQEANNVIDTVGLSEAQNLVMTDGELNPAVRVTVSQILIKKYSDLASKAQDEAIKNYYLDKAIQTASFVTEKLGTEAGQSIQAFSLWSRLSPEGQLRAANQDMAAQGKEKVRRRKKDIKVISDKFQTANEEAAGELTKSSEVKKTVEKVVSKGAEKAKEKIQKAKDKRKELFDKYKGKKGGGLTLSSGGLTKEGIEYVGELVKTYIDEGIANIQLVATEIVNHLKSIGANVSDEVSKNVNDIINQQFDVSINKKTTKALGELEKEIQKIVNEHYTIPEEAKTTLINKFIERVGLEKEDAEQLAKEVQAEFDRIATRKKRNILYNEKARFDKINNTLSGDKKPEQKTVQSDIIKYSNLGAFDEEEFAEMVASKFGIGEISKEQAAKLIELANKIQKAPEGSPKNNATEDLLNYRAKLRGNDLGETAQAVWYSNVLSGYKTHEKNLVSTFFNSMGELGAEMLKDPKAIPYILAGYAKGVATRGRVEAAHTIKTGRSPIHIKKIETPNVLERKAFLGGGFNPANWFKYVMRLMVAEDVLSFQGLKEARAYQLARREAQNQGYNTWSKKGWDRVNEILLHTKERWAEADAQATEEGMKGLEKKRRIYELMENSRPTKMTEDAYGFAAHGTFNHESEGSLGAITNVVAGALDAVSVGGVKPLRFLVPFTRIITNVVNNSLDFTPIGFVRAARGVRGFRSFEGSSLTKSAFKELDKGQRQRLIAKAAIGVSLTAILQGLHEAGIITITGAGPDDDKKKQQLMQEGWHPYSIKIGNKWYSYQYTPMVFMIGFLGNMNDAKKYGGADTPSLLKQTQIAASRIGGQIVDMTWINSASTFLGALAERNPNSQSKQLSGLLGNTVKGFVPFSGAITQSSQFIQNAFQIPQKQVNNAWQALIQDIPIARNSLDDKINALGDPIVRDNDVVVSTETKDPVWKYLLEKNGWVAPVNKNTIIVYDPELRMDRPVSNEEYYEFSKLRGQKIKDEIKRIIADGATVVTKAGAVKKTAYELTENELNVLLTNIEGAATKQTKKELFEPRERNRMKVFITPKR